jgi:chorismate synthase
MRFLSAGESHGKVMTAILSGFPAGVEVDEVLLKSDIARRRLGLGKSPRLVNETDEVKIVSGVSEQRTTGAPISFLLENNVSFIDNRVNRNEFPRPGHVDYAGSKKFGHSDAETSAERSSARETVLRVAAGSLCKMFLRYFDINAGSEVLEIGGIPYKKFNPDTQKETCRKNGSIGGVIKVDISGVPAGLGSNEQWFTRLDSMIAGAVVSIPSVKGVYIGDTDIHRKKGLESLDSFISPEGDRSSNKSGGIEGGISNGRPLIVTAFFKPVPTQPFEVDSFSLKDGLPGKTRIGQNDMWCVERAAVIVENIVCMTVAESFLKKFGSDCLVDIEHAYKAFRERCRK